MSSWKIGSGIFPLWEKNYKHKKSEEKSIKPGKRIKGRLS